MENITLSSPSQLQANTKALMNTFSDEANRIEEISLREGTSCPSPLALTESTIDDAPMLGVAPPPFSTMPQSIHPHILPIQKPISSFMMGAAGAANHGPSAINSMDTEAVLELKQWLTNAPEILKNSKNSSILTYTLPNGELINCVFWRDNFYITGTDIVKILLYRFASIGRPILNAKKFEEGVFSDLRNLKPGIDAILEDPRSSFLEFLYRNGCIRTQKKQKVFFWYRVTHDDLFMDALERDLKREANLMQMNNFILTQRLSKQMAMNLSMAAATANSTNPSSPFTNCHPNSMASMMINEQQMSNPLYSMMMPIPSLMPNSMGTNKMAPIRQSLAYPQRNPSSMTAADFLPVQHMLAAPLVMPSNNSNEMMTINSSQLASPQSLNSTQLGTSRLLNGHLANQQMNMIGQKHNATMITPNTNANMATIATPNGNNNRNMHLQSSNLLPQNQTFPMSTFLGEYNPNSLMEDAFLNSSETFDYDNMFSEYSA